MKKRIFTALEISEATRQKAADYINYLRQKYPQTRGGWDKPEKMHLTMKFLGEVDEDRLARLTGAVERAAREIPPFSLRIAGTGVFPSRRQARVLWLGVRDEMGVLQKLNEKLESECGARGLAGEKRSFKAHLTIARLKERAVGLVEAHLSENFEAAEFEVSEIVVFSSELRQTGSVYTVISKHQLTGMTG